MQLDFSEKLAIAMKTRGVTAKELAKRSGISESRISQYKRGVYKPKSDAMNCLAKALTVNPYWFEGTSDEMDTFPHFQSEHDLTPFDMKLLNMFHRADNNTKEGICLILGIDTRGVNIKQTRVFSDNEINN